MTVTEIVFKVGLAYIRHRAWHLGAVVEVRPYWKPGAEKTISLAMKFAIKHRSDLVAP